MDNGRFYKLNRWSNYGFIHFIDPRKPKRTELKLEDGQKATIKWPDGFESVETIRVKVFNDTVYDMGHEYPVTYKLAGH